MPKPDAKRLLAALVDVSGVGDDPKPPSKEQSPSQTSPVGGDDVFYTYFLPGAIFQAKDGTLWMIDHISDMGMVRIINQWRPREQAVVPVQRIRETIAAYVDPVQIMVPPLLEVPA